MIHFMNLIHLVYNFLWGDLITIPLPGGSSLGLSLLVLLLVPTAIYFTLRTRFLPFRLFPETERHGSELKLQLRNIDGGNDKRALQQLPAAEFRLNVPGLKGSQKLMPLHRYAAAPDAGTVPVKRVYPGGLHIHIINGGLFQHG